MIILLESKERNNKKNKQINYLYNLYKYDYNSSKKYKRLPYLYNSILYLTNDINFNIPLISNKSIVLQTQLAINTYFKSKKIYEHVLSDETMTSKDKTTDTNSTKRKYKESTVKEICSNKLDIFNNLDPII